MSYYFLIPAGNAGLPLNPGKPWLSSNTLKVEQTPLGSKEVISNQIAGAGVLMILFSEGAVSECPIIHIKLLNEDNKLGSFIKPGQEIHFKNGSDANSFFLSGVEIICNKIKAGKRFLCVRDFLISNKRMIDEWRNWMMVAAEEEEVYLPLLNYKEMKVEGICHYQKNLYVQIKGVKVFDLLGDFSHIEYQITRGLTTIWGELDPTKKMIVERYKDQSEALRRFKEITTAIEWIDENNRNVATHSNPLALLSLALETLYGKLPRADNFSVRLCREIALRKLVA